MIIDFHTHIYPPEIRSKRDNFFDNEPAFKLLYDVPNAKIAGAEDIIRNMDDEGIDKSVVFGFPWYTEEHYKKNNDYILESVEKHKDRLTGFCTFFPLAEGAENELERCLKAGLSGVGELGFYTSSITKEIRSTIKPLGEIAEKYDVPILLHVNEPLGHYYPGKAPIFMNDIYEFLRCFRNNKIILAHWGGGILFYYLMKKEVKEVLRNTWFDTAASPFLYDKEIYSIAVKILGPEKILLGSDYPLIKPGRNIKEMREAGLPKEELEKICGLNAENMLG